MTAQVNAREFVDIPREPTLSQPLDTPPLRIWLPAELSSRAGPWLSGAAIFATVLLGGSLAALSSMAVHAVTLRSAGDVFVASLLLLTAAFSVFFLLTVITGFVDLVRGSRLLVLGGASFLDRRQCRQPILWSDVSHARVTYTRWGFAGVHLKLRRPIEACHNPFRIGTTFALWRRHPDELHVSIIFLNWSGHDIAHTILALVKLHGGGTDLGSPDPWRDWLNAKAK
jgi:hypothetical protein